MYPESGAKSAQILTAVLQAMAEPVMVLDLAEERWHANQAAIDLLGFDPGQLAGKAALERIDLRHVDGRPVSFDDLPSTRALRGEPVQHEPFRLHSQPGGRECGLLVSASPLYVDGELFGVSSVWVDITLQERAEQTQQQLLAQLRQERLQAEHQAAEASRRLAELEAVIEAIAEPVVMFDRAGLPRRVNSSALSAYGFDPTGLPVPEIIQRLAVRSLDGSPIQVSDMASQKARKENRITRARYIYRHSDGQDHIIHAAAAPVDMNGTRLGVVSVWSDVTERELLWKENEQQRVSLLRQQTLLERLVREAPAGIAFLEGTEHRYVLANAAYEHIARSKGELIGRTVAQVWPEVAAEIVPLLDGVYRTGQAYAAADQPFQIRRAGELETDYFTFTFTPIHDIHGQVEGVMILAVETTNEVVHRQLLRAERDRLQASEERFRQLADSMPQLVWTARPDGTVDYYNQRYKEYSGISPTGGENWKWAPVLHPDDLQPTLEAWQQALQSGQTYQIEHRVQMANGEYCWHLSRGEPARDQDGRLTRWYGTATNIHDLKQAQAALKSYAERLESSNRELQEFAFVASHDLQEPLRKIEAFGDALLHQAGPKLDEQQQNYLERMRSAAGRMRKMIDDLLALSRITTRARPFEWIDLNQVLDEVVYDLEMQIRRTSGRVAYGELPRLQADAFQMRQLFQNLVGNGLKFHRPEQPPVVQVSSTVLARQVQITVSDNGIGFDEPDAERIFQPFQRLVGRSQYEGNGMGLAICRRIVERHHGQIQAHSAPGQGTRFVITLPVEQPAVEGKTGGD